MRWSIIGLVLVGVVAALCAAVLVTMLKGGEKPTAVLEAEEVSIVLAKRALPPMTVVDGDSVEMRTVPKAEAPPDHVVGAAFAVGKVLSVPMVKGEVFTETCFAKRGSGVHLAAALPKGMRAVSIPIDGYTSLEGLLYPGSVVDVMASFGRSLGGPVGLKGQSFSIPLLERVQVLAIEKSTVFTPDEAADESGALRRGNRMMVTLMVSPKQAQALQLAMEHGRLLLAMRNPLDGGPLVAGWTRLSEITVPGAPPEQPREPAAAPEAPEEVAMADPEPVAMPVPTLLPVSAGEHEVEVIRGRSIETISFPSSRSVPVSLRRGHGATSREGHVDG